MVEVLEHLASHAGALPHRIDTPMPERIQHRLSIAATLMKTDRDRVTRRVETVKRDDTRYRHQLRLK